MNLKRMIAVVITTISFIGAGYFAAWNITNSSNVNRIYNAAMAAKEELSKNSDYKVVAVTPVGKYLASRNVLVKTAESLSEGLLVFEAERSANNNALSSDTINNYQTAAQADYAMADYFNITEKEKSGLYPYHNPLVDYLGVRNEIYEKLDSYNTGEEIIKLDSEKEKISAFSETIKDKFETDKKGEALLITSYASAVLFVLCFAYWISIILKGRKNGN